MYGPPNCEAVEKWWSPVSGLFFSKFWACWTVWTLTPYLEVGQNLNGSSAQRDPACDREATSVWLRSYHIESCVAAVFRFVYDANAYMRRVLRQFGQDVDHIWNIRFSNLYQFACCHPHFETWPNPNPLCNDTQSLRDQGIPSLPNVLNLLFKVHKKHKHAGRNSSCYALMLRTPQYSAT